MAKRRAWGSQGKETTGNKNKLVCKMLGQWPFDTMDAFDKIEKKAGRQIFSGEFSRTNLRTLTLLDDFLIYGKNGKNKVYQFDGGWRVEVSGANASRLYVYDDNIARGRVHATLCVRCAWPTWGAWTVDFNYDCK